MWDESKVLDTSAIKDKRAWGNVYRDIQLDGYGFRVNNKKLEITMVVQPSHVTFYTDCDRDTRVGHEVLFKKFPLKKSPGKIFIAELAKWFLHLKNFPTHLCVGMITSNGQLIRVLDTGLNVQKKIQEGVYSKDFLVSFLETGVWPAGKRYRQGLGGKNEQNL